MKRGVFGGRFDPFHKGHLGIIEWCLSHRWVDYIELIPTAFPVHKPIQTDYQTRKKQIETAIRPFNQQVRINDLEWQRPDRPSWMIDTITTIQTQYPADQLYLIMGSDTLIDLPRWHQTHALQRMVELIVFNRPSHPIPPIQPWAKSHIMAPIHWVLDSNWPYSSTDVRAKTRYVLGITGRMGSGKTTASHILSTRYGVPIIELDDIGHHCLKDPLIQTQLTDYFGPIERTESGDIDRTWLGQLVFGNPAHLDYLNQVMHPHIRQRCIQLISQSSAPIMVITGALIQQIGLLESCDHVWVIDSDDDALQTRLGEKAHRLQSQLSRSDYLKLGPTNITNQSLDEFSKTIDTTFQSLCMGWGMPCTPLRISD